MKNLNLNFATFFSSQILRRAFILAVLFGVSSTMNAQDLIDYYRPVESDNDKETKTEAVNDDAPFKEVIFSEVNVNAETEELGALENEESLAQLPSYKIGPNPCQGQIEMAQNNNNVDILAIQVFDTQGRLIREIYNIPNQQFQLNNLPTGLLFVRLTSKNTLTGEAFSETRQIVSVN